MPISVLNNRSKIQTIATGYEINILSQIHSTIYVYRYTMY